jgi:hypothetical protein
MSILRAAIQVRLPVSPFPPLAVGFMGLAINFSAGPGRYRWAVL